MKTPSAPQKAPEESTIGGTQLAELVGVSERRIRQLSDENKCPQPVNGRWPTTATLKALFEHYRTSQEPDKLAEERLRNLTLDADLKEIEKEQQLRNWIPASAVTFIWDRQAGEMSTIISQAPIPQETKEALCDRLQAIPIDEYFAELDSKTASETDAEPEAKQEEPKP
jgi:phage terminase Nu1 subunit (DNA packaging protein)